MFEHGAGDVISDLLAEQADARAHREWLKALREPEHHDTGSKVDERRIVRGDDDG